MLDKKPLFLVEKNVSELSKLNKALFSTFQKAEKENKQEILQEAELAFLTCPHFLSSLHFSPLRNSCLCKENESRSCDALNNEINT